MIMMMTMTIPDDHVHGKSNDDYDDHDQYHDDHDHDINKQRMTSSSISE